MKRAVIGGFLSVIGAMFSIAILYFAANHMASEYAMPPGRLLSTLAQNGTIFPMMAAVALLAAGLIMMLQEYSKKDD